MTLSKRNRRKIW